MRGERTRRRRGRKSRGRRSKCEVYWIGGREEVWEEKEEEKLSQTELRNWNRPEKSFMLCLREKIFSKGFLPVGLGCLFLLV